ncbi:MAG: YggU family protein [Deltaproteobacteria bacterium]|nr:YggU family protein [Deltaproteobacteria bacterium]
MLYLKTGSDGVVFKVHIQPRASKNSVAGIFDDAVKIRLTAPPVDNAANRLCVKFLSKELKLPKKDIEIVSGHTGRNKQILIRSSENRPENTIKDMILSLVAGRQA